MGLTLPTAPSANAQAPVTPFFGRSNAQRQSQKQEQVPAKFWLNFGHLVEVEDAEGNRVQQFVSLPWGVPLDTQTPLDETANNEGFAFLNQARNDLLAQVLAFARTLKPGEERILPGTICGLQIQIRHVREKRQVSGENPFKVKLALAG